MDEGQIVGCQLVVTSRDSTTLLDLIEESFDQVARSIEIRAEADRLVTITSRRGVCPSAPLNAKPPDPNRVITPVAPPPAPSEAIIAGRIWTKFVRQVPPRRPGPQYPKDAVEDTAVVHPWNAARLVRQHRLNSNPFVVC